MRRIGGGFISALQEIEQSLVRRRRLPDVIVRQDELTELAGISGGLRTYRRIPEPGRLGIGVGVKDRLLQPGAARPKTAAADLVRIGLAGNPVGDIRRARMQRR